MGKKWEGLATEKRLDAVENKDLEGKTIGQMAPKAFPSK